MTSNFSLLTKDDVHYFNEGRFFKMYEKLGAHVLAGDAKNPGGVHFAVWAPNARSVSVVGDFNFWGKDADYMHPVGSSGIWACVVPQAKAGQVYKYNIVSNNGYEVQKADPLAFRAEKPPLTGSVIWDGEYKWNDAQWMTARSARQAQNQPMSIYEVHLESWRRKPEEECRSLTYRELADELVSYVKDTGYTHVELLPIMEYPFGGSWGYQLTGYFAPTSRFGTPEDFMYLIDQMHANGIGVILDWVPSHFPGDEHGLAYFDGTHLYEHADPRQGYHPDWKSYIFNYGRNEVRSFLISNALFWLEKYHIDGLRVDAVASMLYLDYSREQGEWIPNAFGGRENLDAIKFLRDLNEAAYSASPGVQIIAEESTAWPMVSKPTYIGGLGFGYKWDMGWMHDTIKYFQEDPINRKYHHNVITFRAIYMFSENYVLSLSHDEVVYGKGSMICKMPGDEWQKFANLRCLYTYMFSQPGKKLMFMGDEFAQWREWNHESSLDWHIAGFDRHQQMRETVKALNTVYKTELALQFDCDPRGFQWVDASDKDQSVISYLRISENGEDVILCAFNFTPMPRHNYQIGVPRGGYWQEIFSSDNLKYGGSGLLNPPEVEAAPFPLHGQPCLVNLTLPPLGGVFLKWKR